ncbi:MAG: hypothetical protein HRT61_09145 [Ekhidna sp.]|nr:hypothetical protein [Ekhidna sp.]
MKSIYPFVNRSKWCLIICFFLLNGCKSSETFWGSESVTVQQLKTSYRNEVKFVLLNQSEEVVQIESSERFYIEKMIGEQWIRIPHIPCKCGTPCRPPATLQLFPNEHREISWDLISRKCGNEAGLRPAVQTLEERVSSGQYRMVFTINRQKEGMRLAPESLTVNFDIKN